MKCMGYKLVCILWIGEVNVLYFILYIVDRRNGFIDIFIYIFCIKWNSFIFLICVCIWMKFKDVVDVIVYVSII